MSWLNALRERVSLLRRDQRDRELNEEIAQHLAAEAQRLVSQGLPPDEARREALNRFGDPVEVADATRDARGHQPLENAMQDVRYALRSLSRNPGFALVALATLALGTGATIASFAVLDSVLLRPLPYRDPGALVFLREVNARQALNPPSHPNVVDWRDRNRSFDGIASAMYPFPSTVRATPGISDPERITVMGVSRDFFRILGAPPVIGREFTAEENRLGGPRVAMVSHEYWQNSMGARQPLGSLAFGETTRAVVGVLPPGFRFISEAGIYLPHEQFPGTCRTCRNYMVIGRLKDGVSIDAARSDMRTLSAAMVAEYGSDTNAQDVDVTPLLDFLVGDYRLLLGTVFAASALVLLIACTNLLSAQLARAWSREREVLVRAALGASRGRLLRQLTVESAILVVAGSIAGILLAMGLTSLVRTIGADLLPRLGEVAIDARIAGLAVAVMVFVTVAVGIYPALRLSRSASGLAARGARGATSAVRMSAWRALLGFEIALAVSLSIGATLLVRTFRNILDADTGFASNGVVTAAITPSSENDVLRLDDARREIEALPGITGAAYTTSLPLSWGSNSGPVRRPTDPAGPEWPAMAGFRMVTPGYFEVLQQPLLRGRSFTEADRDGAAPVAIISSGIAEKLWPGEDPIGKVIGTNYLWDEWQTVVGVVAEASSWTQPKGAQNEIYVPMSQHMHALEGQGQVVAVVRTSVPVTAMVAPVRNALKQVIPNAPARVSSLEERILRSAADRRFAMVALVTFAAIALLLAAIGIYGVIWYIVTTRVQELGVRMALGATPEAIRRGVLASAAVVAAIGLVAGAAAAMAGGRVLESTLYGISHVDPGTYAVSGVVVLLAVLLGAWIPARRASRVDPLVAMRTDA